MFITLALVTLAYSPVDFDKTDIALLTTLVVESTFDVMQTRAHLNNGTWQGEADPVLGLHPGALRLWGTYAIAQIVAIGVAKLLPNPYRKIFELLATGFEADIITYNIMDTRRCYSWRETMRVSF